MRKKFEFKKVPLEDVYMVYELYCEEQKCEIIDKDFERAKEIYGELLSRGNYTFACYINNKVIAVVNIYKNMQYYPTELNMPYVHLECVIVSKNWQNQGIGTKLITKAVSLVKSEGCTYIIGQSSNPYMQKVFYKSGLTVRKYEDFRYENIYFYFNKSFSYNIIIFFEIIGLLMLSFIIGKFASLVTRSGSHISLEKLEKGTYYCREYKALEDYYVYTGDIKEKIGNRVHKVSFINEYGKGIELKYIGKDNIGGTNIIVACIPIKKDDDLVHKFNYNEL